MTVRIDIEKDRERMKHIKESGGYMPARLAKELVLDESYKDNKKRGYIYESPDGGKTIYRRATQPCEDKKKYNKSGVRIDDSAQMTFVFDEFKKEKKLEDIFDKLNVLEAQVRDIRKSLIELE